MKIIKTVLFYLAQLIVCGVILEIICYFFLLHSDNPLYRARKILVYDPIVGWMQERNLETTFEKKSVFTDGNGFRTEEDSSDDDVFKTITLGPSSAFGWGVNIEETYSALIAKHFNKKNLNASGIGHSILQGERVWHKKLIGKNLSLSHAFIAYGVNDLDKFRFFDSHPVDDKTYFMTTPEALDIDKARYPGNLPIVLSLVWRQFQYQKKCDQLVTTVQRVSWNEYESALTSLIQEMKYKKIIPVIINTPFYLKNKNPKFSVELINDTYGKVSKLAQGGNCKEAHIQLKIAKELEPDNIQVKVLELNEHLKNFAEKNHILYIDAYKILAGNNEEDNFVDPVHPSVLGHKKIADELIKALL